MEVFPRLTRTVPLFRSNAYERLVLRLAAGCAGSVVSARSTAVLRRVETLRRALIIADINIGDAILLQSAVASLHHRLPGVEFDYAFNHKMGALISPDPAIHQAHPVLRGRQREKPANLRRLEEVFRRRSYDLVLNFCPFFTTRDLAAARCPVVHSLGFAIDLLRTYRAGEIASMPTRAMAWVDALTERLETRSPMRSEPATYTGTRVYVPASSARHAAGFFAGQGLNCDRALVFVNPDTSNYTTFTGVELQVEVIRRLLRSGRVDAVVLGRGFTYSGVENQILDALGLGERDRVVVCPGGQRVEDFAAVVDRCQAYIGGDTGPLHIAAARKIDPSGSTEFANAVAVVGVFKATEPRLYGYDSHRPDMADSSQDAVAVTVEQRPPCKNLTCSLQRVTGSCPAGACHDALESEPVVLHALSALAAAPPREEWLAATGSVGR
jgi:ADP-heptose:LPS heptosyltransferase